MEKLVVDCCERNSTCPNFVCNQLTPRFAWNDPEFFLGGIAIEKGGLWFVFWCKYIHSTEFKSIDIWLLVLPSSSAKKDSSNLVALIVQCGKHVSIVDLTSAIRLPAARNLCDLKSLNFLDQKSCKHLD